MKTLSFSLLLLALTTTAFATQDKKELKLRIQATNGNLDETSVFFDLGVTSDFSATGDAPKILAGLAGVPSIYSITSDNVNCSINGFGDLSETAVIALGVVVDSSGLFTISAPEMSKFDVTTLVTLEDRQLNVYTDLRKATYQVQVNSTGTANGRFFLHILKAVQFTSSIAGCANNDATITLSADTSAKWNMCQLFDSNDVEVGRYADVNGQFGFTDLSEGNYRIDFSYGTYATSHNIHINSNHISADVAASHSFVNTGEEINFSSVTSNATEFAWDFGDGSIISGIANPTMSYYTTGNFMVNLKCSNAAGCSANVQLAMTVSNTTGINDPTTKPVSIIVQNKSVSVKLSNTDYVGAEMHLFNLLGQAVYTSVLTDQTTVLGFNGQPAGYYIVEIQKAEKTSTQKIYIN